MSRFFGPLIQMGYVVRDIEKAMDHWTERLGVGPFFYIEHLSVPDFAYLGRPSPVELSLALANSGTMQIELIQQRNEAPSMYQTFRECLLRKHGAGVQHLGFGTDHFDEDMTRALTRNYRLIQQGTGGSRGRFAYFVGESGSSPLGAHAGNVVELIDLSRGRKELFEAIYLASVGWDGHNPIREKLPL